MDDVEILAERYAGEIEGLLEAGPVVLAGWSLGGVIAYEMARRITAKGPEARRIGASRRPQPRE